jgi:hypothetical protein
MASEFTIDRVVPDTYLDQGGNPVNGHLIYFTLTEFGEQSHINVPSITPSLVKERIEAFLEDRKKLAELGG